MTPEKISKEAVDKLNALNGDPESDHGTAEKILCEALSKLGHPEIAKAFNDAAARVEFWYA